MSKKGETKAKSKDPKKSIVPDFDDVNIDIGSVELASHIGEDKQVYEGEAPLETEIQPQSNEVPEKESHITPTLDLTAEAAVEALDFSRGMFISQFADVSLDDPSIYLGKRLKQRWREVLSRYFSEKGIELSSEVFLLGLAGETALDTYVTAKRLKDQKGANVIAEKDDE